MVHVDIEIRVLNTDPKTRKNGMLRHYQISLGLTCLLVISLTASGQLRMTKRMIGAEASTSAQVTDDQQLKNVGIKPDGQSLLDFFRPARPVPGRRRENRIANNEPS